MVLGEPFGSSLEDSIIMLLTLALVNSFVTREGYFIGVSLVLMTGLMFVTQEGYLIVISLVLPLGSPLEFPNPWDELGFCFDL